MHVFQELYSGIVYNLWLRKFKIRDLAFHTLEEKLYACIECIQSSLKYCYECEIKSENVCGSFSVT